MPGSKSAKKSSSKTPRKRATSKQVAARKKFSIKVKKVSKLMKKGYTKKQAWAELK